MIRGFNSAPAAHGIASCTGAGAGLPLWRPAARDARRTLCYPLRPVPPRPGTRLRSAVFKHAALHTAPTHPKRGSVTSSDPSPTQLKAPEAARDEHRQRPLPTPPPPHTASSVTVQRGLDGERRINAFPFDDRIRLTKGVGASNQGSAIRGECGTNRTPRRKS